MTKLAYRVTRWIRGYQKDGDELVEELHLEGVGLPQLRNLFAAEADDLLMDCYPVSAPQAKALRQYLPKALNLHRLDYFLECDAEPERAPRKRAAPRTRTG